MKLIPPLTTKLSSKTSPGELVRMSWRAETTLVLLLGIVTKDARDRTGAVCLASDPSNPAIPGYLPFSEPVFVLSYGFDYSFHVPPNSGGRPYHPDFSPFGVMLIRPDRAMIRVASLLPSISGGFYNIATGELLDTDNPRRECWALPDWDIRLNAAPATAPPLLAFRAS